MTAGVLQPSLGWRDLISRISQGIIYWDDRRALRPQNGGILANPSYAELLALIPNKKFVFDSSTSSASAGTTLTSSPWDNSESATDATGTATWETNIFGSKRGVLANANTEFVNTGLTLATLLPTGRSLTFFAAELRTINTSNQVQVLADSSGFMSIFVPANSREFRMSTTPPSTTSSSGISYTDSVPYVLAVRLDSSGGVRFNFNGTIGNFPSAGLPVPGTKTGTARLNVASIGSGTAYLGGSVFANTEMADADMDAFAVAMRSYYGI